MLRAEMCETDGEKWDVVGDTLPSSAADPDAHGSETFLCAACDKDFVYVWVFG
jgi:hypothetical protein